MVAYNFQARFAPLVEAASKTQTICADGARRHARIGERVQLYTGMRQRTCRLLMNGVCTATYKVRLIFRPVPKVQQVLQDGNGDWVTLTTRLHPRDLFNFANADGFCDWDELAVWFAQTHGDDAFEGTLVKWKPVPVLTRAPKRA